jgi:pimeloyl-ACP methyl ester carboxylesterase
MFAKFSFFRWLLGLAVGVVALSSAYAQQEAQDVKGAYLDIGGSKIYYEETGQGSPLVLIHDGLVHREVWDAQFKAFADHYRVIRYDRRGYGLSEMPTQPYSNIEDLRALLHHLSVKQAILIGSSAGGGVAVDFALAYPDRVDALVLVGAAISGYGFSEHFLRRQQANTAPLAQGNAEATLRNWINDRYITLASNAAARERIRALLTPHYEKLLKNPFILMRQPASPALGRLSEIRVPTLIIVGEADIPDVHAHAGVLEVGIPRAKRVIVPDAGHLVYVEQPETFNRIVLDFLQQ